MPTKTPKPKPKKNPAAKAETKTAKPGLFVFKPDMTEQAEKLGALLTIEQIADFFGIARRTMFLVMGRQPEVGEAINRGRSRAIGSVAKGLLQQALDGNMTAAMFYLKTQAGWRETQHLDHTSSDGSMSPRPAVDVTKLSTAALKEIVAAANSNDDSSDKS